MSEAPDTPQARLEALVREWQPRLALSHWLIRITLVASRTNCSADIQIDRYRRHAMVRMNDDHPEDLWPSTVVHELLHLLTEPLEMMVAQAIERVPAGEREVLQKWRFEMLEPLIEQLTDVIIGQPRPMHPNIAQSWRLVE